MCHKLFLTLKWIEGIRIYSEFNDSIQDQTYNVTTLAPDTPAEADFEYYDDTLLLASKQQHGDTTNPIRAISPHSGRGRGGVPVLAALFFNKISFR